VKASQDLLNTEVALQLGFATAGAIAIGQEPSKTQSRPMGMSIKAFIASISHIMKPPKERIQNAVFNKIHQ
jgi:hypothetical protein